MNQRQFRYYLEELGKFDFRLDSLFESDKDDDDDDEELNLDSLRPNVRAATRDRRLLEFGSTRTDSEKNWVTALRYNRSDSDVYEHSDSNSLTALRYNRRG